MLNQGRVHLAPRIGLAPGPCELSLPAGPLAEQVGVDPAMCRVGAALRRAGPGQRHRRQGHDFHPARLLPRSAGRSGQQRHLGPAGDSFAGDGIGPMLHALSVLLGGDAPAQLRQGSVVAFRMKDRRVYHDGLELVFPALTVRTSGSVGLDRTMDLTAEMPVPPRWLGNNAAAIRAVASQTIRLPLRGTLERPELDPRAYSRPARNSRPKPATCWKTD